MIVDACALALGLLAVPLDLGLPGLQLALPAANLLLRARELVRGCLLRVALERVGKLGGRADQVESVHADGVPGRIDGRRASRRLKHAQLGLELGRVAPEGVK